MAVAGGHRFVQIAVGQKFACGRTVSLEVWCWGQATPDVLTPILLETNAYGVSSVGGDVATFSPGTALQIWTWGGATKQFPLVSKGLEGLSVAGFAANNSQSCVHLADGQVYCSDVMWDHTTSVPYDYYVPVQPVRTIP
ncbi:MAG: hypothetical protein R2910_06115 [Gemmatimonadales bacterium]